MDSEFLELLACPACRSELCLKEEPERLVCSACRRSYPIKDGIPVLLVDEATIEGESDAEEAGVRPSD
jgi:uncharacterized protein YbaR (Trm112 family)